MTRFLPLFPLKLVAFPGEILNLHIFEPRYKELVQDLQGQDKTFGIPAFIKDRVMDFGTEMKILSIEKTYDNGEMDIRTKGVGIFKLLEFLKEVPNKQYPAGIVADQQVRSEQSLKPALVKAVKELYEVLGMQLNFDADLETLCSFDIAHYVGFSLEQSYDLLRLTSEDERQNLILLHLRDLIPVLKQAEDLKKRIKMNGHFRNEIPPEI